MRRQKSDEQTISDTLRDENRERKGKTGRIRRVLYAAVFLFVIAGLSGLTYLMRVVLPQENRRQADSLRSTALRTAQVGESVFWGSYEQDNDLSDGTEPIEWLVLARKQDKLLLVSKYALDYTPFNDGDGFTSWDYSTILQWLNDEFYTAAFSAPEQTTVLVSHVPADRNTLFDTDPGKDTNLRMFLLSIAEANAYFTKDDDRRCLPSPYAEAQGAKAQDGGCCMWWLRSPGYDSSAAARVLPNGDLYGRDAV